MRYVFDTNAIISPDLLTLDPLPQHGIVTPTDFLGLDAQS